MENKHSFDIIFVLRFILISALLFLLLGGISFLLELPDKEIESRSFIIEGDTVVVDQFGRVVNITSEPFPTAP